MTDVIVEAMKTHIGDSAPSDAARLKGLSQALKDLERARASETLPSKSDCDSSSYYSDSLTSSTSSDPNRQRSRRSPSNKAEPEFHTRTSLIDDWAVPNRVETNNIQRSRAVVKRSHEGRVRRKRGQMIANIARMDRSADDKLVLSYMFHETGPLHFRRTLDRELPRNWRTLFFL